VGLFTCKSLIHPQFGFSVAFLLVHHSRSAVVFDNELFDQYKALVHASIQFYNNNTGRALVDCHGKAFTSQSCHTLWIKQFAAPAGSETDSLPKYPRKVTYGLLRAQAICDSVQHMNESFQLQLANKFAHDPATRDKYYKYLCTNAIAVSAVEGMKLAAAKESTAAATKVSLYRCSHY
jgi:hypothetical protein